ncbi:MAG: sugar phosphate isomerase/epimerase [Sedimentisphaerales bacterium]|nr:sugar phosphate isomerase/epimerase [Sedimentisphaerales bacterium]
MIKCNDWPISVCTWSLGNDFDKLGQLRDQTQINHLNFAVAPAMEKAGDKYLARLDKEGWQISCTMISFPQEDYSTLESIKVTGGIIPDDYWDKNKNLVLQAIDITNQLGIEYLMFHFGFLDHSDKDGISKFTDRVKLLANAAAEKKVTLLMETGQETATDLRRFIEQLNHPAIAVNLDPANIILYDKGEPIEAVRTLAQWIKHIHIKDAVRTKTPGSWGSEVPWGTGEVKSTEFLKALQEINFAGALAIEREGGTNRLGDIKTAAEALINFAG